MRGKRKNNDIQSNRIKNVLRFVNDTDNENVFNKIPLVHLFNSKIHNTNLRKLRYRHYVFLYDSDGNETKIIDKELSNKNRRKTISREMFHSVTENNAKVIITKKSVRNSIAYVSNILGDGYFLSELCKSLIDFALLNKPIKYNHDIKLAREVNLENAIRDSVRLIEKRKDVYVFLEDNDIVYLFSRFSGFVESLLPIMLKSENTKLPIGLIQTVEQ